MSQNDTLWTSTEPTSANADEYVEPLYFPRLIESQIERKLHAFGAVLIEGPKWCGKTTTARRIAASEIDIADPSGDFAQRRLAQMDPATALEGAIPRLVDEWQEVPKLWDGVRYLCDRRKAKGQFILTGSATPKDAEMPKHSGAGRIARLSMGTMTLLESKVSNGTVRLSALFDGAKPPTVAGSLTLQALAELIVRGGWPETITQPIDIAQELPSEYLWAVAEEDISEVDERRRDPEKVFALLRSLARNESTLASKDLIAKDAENLNAKTVKEYIDVLKRLKVVQDVPAWSPALTSSLSLRKQAKHHLADPSLAAAGMGAHPKRLLHDSTAFGRLFESLVLRDLLVYARLVDARVCHYRDAKGLEVDVILERSDGAWMALEVKLGASQTGDAAKSLLSLRKKMEYGGVRPPEALIVVVGFGGIAGTRSDGVITVPIDCLAA